MAVADFDGDFTWRAAGVTDPGHSVPIYAVDFEFVAD